MSSVDNHIRSWCVGEIAHWKARRLEYRAALAEFEHLNRTRPSLFLFKIGGGEVTIADKPGSSLNEQVARLGTELGRPGSPEVDSGKLGESDLHVGRALVYRDFIQRVVDSGCPRIETMLALDVGDAVGGSNSAPIFVFQKRRGENTLLFPDVDFMNWDFYENCAVDSLQYAAKRISAVFAGATTGGFITERVARELSLPRLRAAQFFKDTPVVDFRLPALVQCTPGAEELLREQGYGRVEDYLSWGDQFTHRFIISMDGNGATCSRVAMALRSRSVLLKYESPSMLYYFPGLIANLHYVPVSAEQDILEALARERRTPGLHGFIAEQGKSFFETYLSRARVMHYAALLIRLYVDSFAESQRAARSLPPLGTNQPEAGRTATHDHASDTSSA